MVVRNLSVESMLDLQSMMQDEVVAGGLGSVPGFPVSQYGNSKLSRQNSQHRRTVSLSISFQPKRGQPATLRKESRATFSLSEYQSFPSSAISGCTVFNRERSPSSPPKTITNEFTEPQSPIEDFRLEVPVVLCQSESKLPYAENVLSFPASKLTRKSSLKYVDRDCPLHAYLVNSCASLDHLHSLLHNGAIGCINKQDPSGRTPLHIAARIGSVPITRLLLAHGADPNIPREDKRTPLHVAAQIPSFELCALLVTHRADVMRKDELGRSVLQEAVESGHYKTVKLLVDTCDNLDSSILEEVLMIASERHLPKIFFALVKKCSIVSPVVLIAAAREGNAEIMQSIASRIPDLDILFNGRTALDVSLENGCFEAAIVLAKLGARGTNTRPPIVWLSEWLLRKSVGKNDVIEIASLCNCCNLDYKYEMEDGSLAGDNVWNVISSFWYLDVCKQAGTQILRSGYRPSPPLTREEHWLVTSQDDYLYSVVAKTENLLTKTLPSELLENIRFWVYCNELKAL